jgi:hypothetical protein
MVGQRNSQMNRFDLGFLVFPERSNCPFKLPAHQQDTSPDTAARSLLIRRPIELPFAVPQ